MTSPENAAAEGVERLGTVISGRYRILELLGTGGMGAVYLAEHTHMKKRVALKLLHPEMSENQEVQARFEREAMAAAHVEHPNVAGATDFGRTEDGAYFLVLEYVEGTSLRDALDAGPITVTRALRITRQIALALERAHDAGIVHRDLKPENVMLVKRDDEPDFVKVLDFGIAKVLELGAAAAGLATNRPESSQPLTRLGTILGTPEYMAPEQALGEAVTPASDLYGVGVMLYEMLTGLHPFDPPDRTAMLSFHIVAPVPLMEDRAPSIHVPAPVEAVVRRLLEKDSKKRYEKARELVEAIDAAAQASGLDLGNGMAPAPPKSAVAPSEPKPWAAGDAFAQTSVGTPAPRIDTGRGVVDRALTDGAGRTSVADTLRRQPRRVLIAVAAALPVGFIVIVVLVLVFRGKRPSMTEGEHGDGGAPTESTPSRIAPADRVAAAVALGPDALEALAKEFPEDATLPPKLASAYQSQGRSADALRVVRALVTAKPAAANDEELALIVVGIAAKGKGDDDDEAFALLEGPFGERGVDALLELSASKGAPLLRTRAQKSLAKPEVRAHASAAAAVFLDLKGAQGCAAKHELMARAKESGDARVLPVLKGLKATRGCGFLERKDCYPCLRKDPALDDAVTAVEARAAR